MQCRLARGSSWGTRASLHTIQKLRTLDVSLFHLFTLICSSLNVTDGGSKDSGSTFHQLLAEVDTVARGSTMQRCPRTRGGNVESGTTQGYLAPVWHKPPRILMKVPYPCVKQVYRYFVNFMCMGVLPECMCVHHVHAEARWGCQLIWDWS